MEMEQRLLNFQGTLLLITNFATCAIFLLMPRPSAWTKLLSMPFCPRQNQNCPGHNFCPCLKAWIFCYKVIQNDLKTHIQLGKVILKVFWQEKIVFLTLKQIFVQGDFNFVLDKTSWTKVLSGQKDKAYMTKLHMHPMHWGFS